MEMAINWEDAGFSKAEKHRLQDLLEQGLSAVLKLCAAADQAEVSLSLVTDDQIRQLNRDYRGLDRPTDVLAFAFKEENPREPRIIGHEDQLLGEIVISVERAQAQAVEYGHSFERELLYLAIHGTLHLLGYDHQTEEERVTMRTKEKEVLTLISN
ncbi:MAG: rRNA maturation RNase YbeY [Desulfitobacteriaceae bacterium]|nr:rRNA maturation RNase YbeY [Desulfitobacteriaceae bacterium]MDD4346603.1 rRNA maturation RNase YbeY [Desulfitobacteriaceae bacterium]MDD4400361.1 rRNA maturation RNase YbeY [Desulfitobacteriaceae bacterium]